MIRILIFIFFIIFLSNSSGFALIPQLVTDIGERVNKLESINDISSFCDLYVNIPVLSREEAGAVVNRLQELLGSLVRTRIRDADAALLFKRLDNLMKVWCDNSSGIECGQLYGIRLQAAGYLGQWREFVSISKEALERAKKARTEGLHIEDDEEDFIASGSANIWDGIGEKFFLGLKYVLDAFAKERAISKEFSYKVLIQMRNLSRQLEAHTTDRVLIGRLKREIIKISREIKAKEAKAKGKARILTRAEVVGRARKYMPVDFRNVCGKRLRQVDYTWLAQSDTLKVLSAAVVSVDAAISTLGSGSRVLGTAVLQPAAAFTVTLHHLSLLKEILNVLLNISKYLNTLRVASAKRGNLEILNKAWMGIRNFYREQYRGKEHLFEGHKLLLEVRALENVAVPMITEKLDKIIDNNGAEKLRFEDITHIYNTAISISSTITPNADPLTDPIVGKILPLCPEIFYRKLEHVLDVGDREKLVGEFLSMFGHRILFAKNPELKLKYSMYLYRAFSEGLIGTGGIFKFLNAIGVDNNDPIHRFIFGTVKLGTLTQNTNFSNVLDQVQAVCNLASELNIRVVPHIGEDIMRLYSDGISGLLVRILRASPATMKAQDIVRIYEIIRSLPVRNRNEVLEETLKVAHDIYYRQMNQIPDFGHILTLAEDMNRSIAGLDAEQYPVIGDRFKDTCHSAIVDVLSRIVRGRQDRLTYLDLIKILGLQGFSEVEIDNILYSAAETAPRIFYSRLVEIYGANERARFTEFFYRSIASRLIRINPELRQTFGLYIYVAFMNNIIDPDKVGLIDSLTALAALKDIGLTENSPIDRLLLNTVSLHFCDANTPYAEALRYAENILNAVGKLGIQPFEGLSVPGPTTEAAHSYSSFMANILSRVIAGKRSMHLDPEDVSATFRILNSLSEEDANRVLRSVLANFQDTNSFAKYMYIAFMSGLVSEQNIRNIFSQIGLNDTNSRIYEVFMDSIELGNFARTGTYHEMVNLADSIRTDIRVTNLDSWSGAHAIYSRLDRLIEENAWIRLRQLASTDWSALTQFQRSVRTNEVDSCFRYLITRYNVNSPRMRELWGLRRRFAGNADLHLRRLFFRQLGIVKFGILFGRSLIQGTPLERNIPLNITSETSLNNAA